MKQKNLFIRVDSGLDVGLGHVMRCFAIAEIIKKMNFNVYFISRKNKGNIIKKIEKSGYTVFSLNSTFLGSTQSHWKNDATKTIRIIKKFKNQENFLLLDNYGLGKMWETDLKSAVSKLIVIDDFSNRVHNCDLFIDQNIYSNKNSLDRRIPKDCKKLLGLEYVLLRKEFIDIRKIVKKHSGKINRIFISFGGSDKNNEISKVLKAIKNISTEKIIVDVIIGGLGKNIIKIKEVCSKIDNCTYHYQPENIAKIMNKADLGIGAGGIMIWERCILGLPSIVSIMAKNQEYSVNTASKLGCIRNLGKMGKLSSEDYFDAIKNFNSQKLIEMQNNCMKLIDGKGAERTAKQISLLRMIDNE
jgi:UDP-2,4-diacetamido-2,4,6-trideoxy-beta-L-altropyranose hydrolase